MSRTEGAARAWEDPGGPVTGRDWSTGCSAEEGSLEVHRNTLHDVKSCCTHTSQIGLLLQFSHVNIWKHKSWQPLNCGCCGVFNHTAALEMSVTSRQDKVKPPFIETLHSSNEE